MVFGEMSFVIQSRGRRLSAYRKQDLSILPLADIPVQIMKRHLKHTKHHLPYVLAPYLPPPLPINSCLPYFAHPCLTFYLSLTLFLFSSFLYRLSLSPYPYIASYFPISSTLPFPHPPYLSSSLYDLYIRYLAHICITPYFSLTLPFTHSPYLSPSLSSPYLSLTLLISHPPYLSPSLSLTLLISHPLYL